MEYLLESWKSDYIKDVAKNADNRKIAAYLRDGFPYPYTYQDAQRYVNSCIENGDSRQLCRAIVIKGEAAGSIGIFLRDDVYRKSAELGYWLAEKYWGNGIMSSAVGGLCKEAFEKYDIVRIFAEPFTSNTGSRRVLEKAGFQLEGIMRKSIYKNGIIGDSCMYALVKD